MVADKHRRLLRDRRILAPEPVQSAKQPTQYRGLKRLFHDHYKQLFIITIVLLLASLVVIGVTFVQTGDVIHKGVSLSGGLTITVPAQEIDPVALQEEFRTRFAQADIIVREISELGTQTGIAIEASVQGNREEDLAALESLLLDALEERIPDARALASTEVIGPSLGASFFAQTTKAVLIAFTLMGMVVFLYFGEGTARKALITLLAITEGLLIWYASHWVVSILALATGALLVLLYVRYSIPSAAVILAAASTTIFTIAVVNLMGMRISTAGIAAFLMLIGYSVDTDILLSTRVLKRSEGTVFERIWSTVMTGFTMQGTTIAAALVGLIFTQSEVIKEIMTIILIGLVADIFFTWIQNAGILRLHLERRGRA